MSTFTLVIVYLVEVETRTEKRKIYLYASKHVAWTYYLR